VVCALNSRSRTDLSKSKTTEMKVHNITDTRLQLGVEKIEEVNEFVNLGSIVFKTGCSDTDIIARIKKSKCCFLTIITHMDIRTNFFKNQNKVI
jgi:hypothetical protein